MDRTRPRHAAPATAAWTTVLVLLSTSCAAVGPGPGPGDERLLQSSADPAVVAWTMANLCRQVCPSSDSLPVQGPTPLVRLGPKRFEVRIGRLPDGPYRGAQNGRLAPPGRTVEGLRVALWPGRFSPAPYTAAERGRDTVHVEIHGRPDGGSTVRVRARGEPVRAGLGDLLAGAVALLSAVVDSARPLARGDAQTAGARAAAALDALPRGAAARLAPACAALYAHVAAARLARGDLTGGRIALSQAVAGAPDASVLGAHLARLDERLARTGDAARAWLRLALDPRGGAAALAAAARLRRLRDALASGSRAEVASGTASRLAASEDHAGALAWARAARTAGDRAGAGRLDHLARARGDHRSAFVAGLRHLDAETPDPDELLQLCADSRAYGDPAAGLRLLVRHWQHLEAARPDAARQAFEQAVAGLPADLTSRVLLVEGAADLAWETLGRWRVRAGPDPAGPRLLARVPELRAAERERLEPGRTLESGWDLAPGVTPPR